MVPGERKLELALSVVRNYSVPQLQPANLPRAVPKAPSMWFHDRKWEQGSSRTGLPCKTDLTISQWLKLFHRPASPATWWAPTPRDGSLRPGILCFFRFIHKNSNFSKCNCNIQKRSQCHFCKINCINGLWSKLVENNDHMFHAACLRHDKANATHCKVSKTLVEMILILAASLQSLSAEQ